MVHYIIVYVYFIYLFIYIYSFGRSKNYELMYGKKLVFSDMKPPEQEKPSKETAGTYSILI